MLFGRKVAKLSVKESLHSCYKFTLWEIHDPFGQCVKIGLFSAAVIFSYCGLLLLGNILRYPLLLRKESSS